MDTNLFPHTNNGVQAGASTQVPGDDSLDFASLRFLNEAAIRLHALRCSAQLRANRFSRVGQDFIDEVKADVEAALRELRSSQGTHGAPALPHEAYFTSGVMDSKLEDIFNDLIGRIIQNKVQRQPSCGKTLGRTR